MERFVDLLAACAVLCCAVPCCAVLCCVVLCCAVPCCAKMGRGGECYGVFCRGVALPGIIVHTPFLRVSGVHLCSVPLPPHGTLAPQTLCRRLPDVAPRVGTRPGRLH